MMNTELTTLLAEAVTGLCQMWEDDSSENVIALKGVEARLDEKYDLVRHNFNLMSEDEHRIVRGIMELLENEVH